MSDLLVFSFPVIFSFLIITLLYFRIREVNRLGGFDDYKSFLVFGVIIVVMMYIRPPHVFVPFDLDDLQVTTGVLDSRVRPNKEHIFVIDSYFTMSGTGEDEEYWYFGLCENAKAVSLKCKGKQITVWHKAHLVFQVAMNDKIIYSLEKSNLKFIVKGLSNFLIYTIIFFFMPIYVFVVNPRLRELEENETRRKFEQRFTTEEVQKPAVTQSEIKNTPEITPTAIHADTMSNRTFNSTDNDAKIVRRFCKNCGAELGEIFELSNIQVAERELKNNDFEDETQKLDYEQYKFCAKCGLDSDPSMPVKPKKFFSTILYKIFIILHFIIIVFFASAKEVRGMEDTIFLISAAIGIMIFSLFCIHLTVSKHECPSCGRIHEKENFCPNCGTYLKKD